MSSNTIPNVKNGDLCLDLMGRLLMFINIENVFNIRAFLDIT